MKLKIKLFAFAKQQIGRDEIELDVAQPATIADVKKELIGEFPVLAGIVSRSAFSVNLEFALDGDEVGPESEIGLIPPVSGG